MIIQFYERPNSRSATLNPQTRTLRYCLIGIHDDAQARAYATAATPIMFDGYFRQSMAIDPKGNGHWDVEVEYAVPDNQIGTCSITFDTTGGDMIHMTQAKAHIASHTKTAVTTGDDAGHKGAINVTKSGPEGVDVPEPSLSWTENWTLPIAYASLAAAMTYKAMKGKVNSESFRGFPAGQVRFDGASVSASTKDPNQATATFKFTQSDDTNDAMPAFKAGIEKKGWEYLWVEYAKEEDAANKVMIQPPMAVHIERVLDPANFGLLGLGTGTIT